MSNISREDVIKMAELSRLKLSEEEIGILTSDLENILGYMKVINEVDTSGIKENAQVIQGGNISRADAEGTVFVDDKPSPQDLQKESPVTLKNRLYEAPSSHN